MAINIGFIRFSRLKTFSEELKKKIDFYLSKKADKVNDANANHFAALDASGNLIDSGHLHSDYITVETDPTVPAWAKEENKPTYNYNEIIDTPDLATVATTGNYEDLYNTPNLAAVATTGNYNDLNNKLILGTNITISSNNVISATDTIYDDTSLHNLIINNTNKINNEVSTRIINESNINRKLNDEIWNRQDADEKLLSKSDYYVINTTADTSNVYIKQNIPSDEIGSTIWTKRLWSEAIIDEDILSDISAKRIVNSEGNESLTSKYITKYCNNLEGSVIYLGQCWSGYDEILAKAFLDLGAEAVIANTKFIQGTYGNVLEYTTISLLSQINENTNNLYTLNEALDKAKELYGENDAVLYKEMSGARAIIYGNKDFSIDLSKTYELVTILPWYNEEAEKGSDTKITLPDGITNLAEIITKAAEKVAELTNCSYKQEYTSKNEILSKNIISKLNKNQIILFLGHGSKIDNSLEETITIAKLSAGENIIIDASNRISAIIDTSNLATKEELNSYIIVEDASIQSWVNSKGYGLDSSIVELDNKLIDLDSSIIENYALKSDLIDDEFIISTAINNLSTNKQNKLHATSTIIIDNDSNIKTNIKIIDLL